MVFCLLSSCVFLSFDARSSRSTDRYQVTTRADLEFWSSQKHPRARECQEGGKESSGGREEERGNEGKNGRGEGISSDERWWREKTRDHRGAQPSAVSFIWDSFHVSLFAHRRAFVILERALPRQSRKHPRVRSSQRMEMWRGVFLRTTHLSCKG